MAEATAKAGGRLKDLKLVLKSSSTWPYMKTYDRDFNEPRQVLAPPLLYDDDNDYDSDDSVNSRGVMRSVNDGKMPGTIKPPHIRQEDMTVRVEVSFIRHISFSLFSHVTCFFHTPFFFFFLVLFFKNICNIYIKICLFNIDYIMRWTCQIGQWCIWKW